MKISWVNPQTIIALVVLAGSGIVAYADVKSDIATNKEKTETNEEQYDRIDRKLDKIIDHLLDRSND